MEEYAALNVRVSPDIVAEVDHVAVSEMRSRSGAVRVLLTEALRRRVAEAERADREVTPA